MTENTRDYFQREYNAFLKAYEIQFTHFMGVFYFWIAVVTFPATAGLIASNHALSRPSFALLLHTLALLGFFLAAKMYDIRCSQLRYIVYMNEARKRLFEMIPEKDQPHDYKPPGKDFRPIKTALRDFGMIMAVVMSIVNAAYTGYALYIQTTQIGPSIRYGLGMLAFGVVMYVLFVWRKLRSKNKAQEVQATKMSA